MSIIGSQMRVVCYGVHAPTSMLTPLSVRHDASEGSKHLNGMQLRSWRGLKRGYFVTILKSVRLQHFARSHSRITTT